MQNAPKKRQLISHVDVEAHFVLAFNCLGAKSLEKEYRTGLLCTSFSQRWLVYVEWSVDSHHDYSEPVFLNVYGVQESIPRNEFRQPM